MLTLEKFSLGVGDRFAHQAKAQLRACMMAAERGVTVIPVWNKSNREHGIVGSEPGSVRVAADAAVGELAWKQPYHVDADHINLTTVDRFIDASDFYTIDVASAIGQPAPTEDVEAFVARHLEITIPRDRIVRIAQKYLFAVQQAGAIYRRIAELRGTRDFITEDGYHITAKCRAYLQPLISGEAFPPFEDGLPKYVRLRNVAVKRKTATEFKL